jgi:F-type H+-transporting ATPase subunit a
VNVVLAAEACPPDNPGCFHVPSLEELFEFPPIFGEGLFAFNRVSLLYVLAAAIVIGLFVAAFKDAEVVPGKLQSVMESIVEFVREQIVIEVIGPAGLKFVPFLTALFGFIFINNFFEIMPLVQMPSTGRMAVPAFLALTVWTLFILVGIKSQGLAYFKNVAIPGGVPAFVLPLVIPIEIVSTFIVRPLTLAVRLFANMMAGHILLAIIFIAANAFLLDVHGGINPAEWNFNLRGAPIGLVALAFGPAMVAFELMVGALQAYIFTILAAVYIGGSLHPEH